MSSTRTLSTWALALLLSVGLCAAPASAQLLAPEQLVREAPESFAVSLETTRGDILIEVRREWAPRGADRFYNLVRAGFYDDVAFFRVVEGFVVQFGIHGRPSVNQVWKAARIEDDPVETRNLRGTVAFATAGKNSRTTQVFINLNDNLRLDSLGFAPFGKVVEGMEIADSLYGGYDEKLTERQSEIASRGNTFLEESFPELDYIVKASVVVQPAE